MPHTSTCTVQDSPPPHRRSALRTIVIIVMLIGLGDLVGRGALRGLEGESWDNEGPDEEHQRGERRPPEEGGGPPGDHLGGPEDVDEDCGEDNHAQQGLAASEGGRLQHGQQGPKINAGEGGGWRRAHSVVAGPVCAVLPGVIVGSC